VVAELEILATGKHAKEKGTHVSQSSAVGAPCVAPFSFGGDRRGGFESTGRDGRRDRKIEKKKMGNENDSNNLLRAPKACAFRAVGGRREERKDKRRSHR